MPSLVVHHPASSLPLITASTLRSEEIPGCDGLSIIDSTFENRPINHVGRHPDHLDFLPRFQALWNRGQVSRHESVHSFVAESRTREVGGDRIDATRVPTDLLFKFSASGGQRGFFRFEFSRTEFEQHSPDGESTDFDHQNRSIRLDRNHRDRSWVADDVLANPSSIDLEVILLDADHRALMTDDPFGAEA
jgi:hypothetical protein